MGCDLLTGAGIDQFKNALSMCNVFINCSQIGLGIQEKLLDIAKESWTSGSIFNVGSVLELAKWEHLDLECAKEKRSLREKSLDYCTNTLKTTHLTLGGFQDQSDPDPERLDPIHIASTIKYILECEYHIPHITVAKVDC
jgi:hypothetical protein